MSSWLESGREKVLGGGEGNPLPVGAVMSERDQALQAMHFFSKSAEGGYWEFYGCTN